VGTKIVGVPYKRRTGRAGGRRQRGAVTVRSAIQRLVQAGKVKRWRSRPKSDRRCLPGCSTWPSRTELSRTRLWVSRRRKAAAASSTGQCEFVKLSTSRLKEFLDKQLSCPRRHAGGFAAFLKEDRKAAETLIKIANEQTRELQAQ